MESRCKAVQSLLRSQVSEGELDTANKFSGNNLRMSRTRPILLGVNIDHIATIRQGRMTRYPDPVMAAMVAEQAGADGITAHLREDRRHIQDRDMERLREMIHSRLNMEMAVTDEMVAIACQIQPHACCLVPEKRAELTTEGGLEVAGQLGRVSAACQALSDVGTTVSLFIDPDCAQIDAAAEAGAPVVELHTGCYADAANETLRQQELERIVVAARHADQAGLQVNAGHGLHYHNVEPICHIPEMVELNIGHAIIARALFSGMEQAVRDMKALMVNARQAIN